MEEVEDLINAISEFKSGSPEARECSLRLILNHPETELIYPALVFILPHLSEKERQTVQSHVGEGVFSEDFKPAEKFISILLISALRSQNPETREQASQIICENEERIGWKVKKEILLLLADPSEETRESCATLLSELKGADTSLFSHFVNTFFLNNLREGRQLVREISTEEEAIPFIYLCLSKYCPSAAEKENDFSVLLLSSLYNHSRDRMDFYQTEYRARQVFLKDHLTNGVRGKDFDKLKMDLESLRQLVITKAEMDLQRRSSIPPRPRISSPPKERTSKTPA
jgi:hypothetical protein